MNAEKSPNSARAMNAEKSPTSTRAMTDPAMTHDGA